MRKILSVLMFCLSTTVVLAQKTISGKVSSSEDGTALPGVTVQVKGTNLGTQSDFDGNYSIKVESNATTLIFSFVGLKTQEVEINGQSTINVSLSSDEKMLSEVVVTALGISKDKKALGYSVQEVKGESLAKARETNVVNSLTGKIAGVQITNSGGGVGSSSRIVIRGNKSLTGNNEPLFVIDGIPIDNTYRGGNYQSGGTDYGNAAADINPDDVETISVLKGPNAAALYGSRAANGVVLITTKSGRGQKGIGVSYSTNATFETPLRLPDYQNQYGQGYNGAFEYVDGKGGGTQDGVDESWGPKLDGSIKRQFFGEGPWVAQPNNIRDFFEVGRTLTNNLAFSASSENVGVRLSYTNLDQKGMLPNTDMRRNTLTLNLNANPHAKLKFDGKATYTHTESDNRPSGGYGGDNVMQQFIWFGRQVDINRLKNYKNADGSQFNWNYNYHNNPYWILNENRNAHRRDRFTGFASMQYNFTDFLNLRIRAGNDWYRDYRSSIHAKGTIDHPNGRFYEATDFINETNIDYLLAFNKDINSDINVSATFGGNLMNRKRQWTDVLVRQLAVPNLYSVANADGNPEVRNRFEEKEIQSLYGTAAISYKDYLFFDMSLRNDWSSTLPKNNNSYFYPSFNASFVLSEAVSLPSFISFGKIRAGWARVGNDTDPYRLIAAYTANQPFNGTPSFTYPNQLLSPELKPEITSSIEAGLDMRFWKDRISLDLTYYKSNTVNQIMEVSISSASGALSQLANAGEIQNQGVEALLNIMPIKKSDFTWEITLNWAKNINQVVSLKENLNTVVLNTNWGLNVEARPGEPYGAFVGRPYLRNAQGQLIVTAAGLPQRAPNAKVLGNFTPDWTGGIRNSFTYKDINLSFLFDMRKGGDVFSMSYMFGRYAGVLSETLEGRETGIVVPGVYANGEPNTTVVTAQRYNQSYYPIHESSIFDGTFVKLRELTISYNLPKSWLAKGIIKGASFSLVGRNLLLFTNVPHIDPETAFGTGNGTQGLEFGQLPTPRSFGFDLRINL